MLAMMGALDPLENESEGVPGRDAEIGLGSREDENVDIRCSQDDLTVLIPLPNTSGSAESAAVGSMGANAEALKSFASLMPLLAASISEILVLFRKKDADCGRRRTPGLEPWFMGVGVDWSPALGVEEVEP